MEDREIAFLAQILIDKRRKELKKIMEDLEANEEEKILAEVAILRSEIGDKSFLIGKKAFEKEENALLIRDYFKLVLAGLESFGESLEKEK